MCFCWRLLWAQESQSVVSLFLKPDSLFEWPVFGFFLNIQEKMYFLYVSANHTFTGWVCNWSTPAVVLAASCSPHTEGGGVCASTTPRVWSKGGLVRFGRGLGETNGVGELQFYLVVSTIVSLLLARAKIVWFLCFVSSMTKWLNKCKRVYVSLCMWVYSYVSAQNECGD